MHHFSATGAAVLRAGTRLMALLGVALMLLSCNGSAQMCWGSGCGNVSPPEPPEEEKAGQEFILGVVTGVGPLRVNDGELNADQAVVQNLWGHGLEAAQLQRGMVLEVVAQAAPEGAGQVPQALSIQTRPALAGRIDEVNAGEGFFRILDQTVWVHGFTVFSSALPAGLGQLQAGAELLVSGWQRQDGSYVATRLDALEPGGAYFVRGTATGYVPGHGQLSVGGAIMDTRNVHWPQDAGTGRLLLVTVQPQRNAAGEWTVQAILDGAAAVARMQPIKTSLCGYASVQAAAEGAPSFYMEGVVVTGTDGMEDTGAAAAIRADSPVQVRGVFAEGALFMHSIHEEEKCVPPSASAAEESGENGPGEWPAGA